MNIIKLSAIDSTNSYLKELSKQMSISDGTIVWATHQKEGRGQQQNVWSSQEGKSLTFSIYKRFEGVPIEQHFKIAMAVSLGVKIALDYLNVPAVTIKWPNDIMSYQKKCCGILIENELKSNVVSSSVIGIGLNVNETHFFNLPNATSLFLATHQNFKIESVLQFVNKYVLYELNLMSQSLDYFKKRFERVLLGYQEQRRFIDSQGKTFYGSITGVRDTGELCITTQQGVQLAFKNKEIQFVF